MQQSIHGNPPSETTARSGGSSEPLSLSHLETEIANLKLKLEEQQRNSEKWMLELGAKYDARTREAAGLRILESELLAVYASKSYRITKPLRFFMKLARGR